MIQSGKSVSEFGCVVAVCLTCSLLSSLHYVIISCNTAMTEAVLFSESQRDNWYVWVITSGMDKQDKKHKQENKKGT
jgi:hypothetical protein